MGFGKLRFRRSFGQVKSQFRGAIPKHFPLIQYLLDLYPATAAYSAYDLGNKRGSVTEAEGTVVNPVQRWRRSSDDALQMFTANGIASGAAMSWLTDDQVGWNTQPFWEVSTGDGVITAQSSTATTSTFSITTTSGASFVRQASKPNHIIASSGDHVVANITMSGFDSTATGILRTSGTNTNVSSQILNNGTADYTFPPTDSAGYFVFSGLEATGGATLTVNSVKVVSRNAYLLTEYDQHDTGLSDLYGSAMYFDGVDDHVVASVGAVSATHFGHVTFSGEFEIPDASSTHVLWALGNDTNRVFVVNGTLYLGGASVGITIATKQRIKIEVDYDSSARARVLRLDGVQVWTGTKSGVDFDNGNLYLGARSSTTLGVFYKGVITKFRINDRVQWAADGNASANFTDTSKTRTFTYNSGVTLPDGSGSAVGKGITVTGIAYDAGENVIWASNFGDDIEPINEPYAPSLLKLNLDGTKILEVDLTSIVGTTGGLQGVAVDTTNNSLWVAQEPGNGVYNLNKDGTLISNFNFTGSNGLAYDSTDDCLWIGTNGGTALSKISKTGVVLETYPVQFSDLDQLTYDAVNDAIWCSAGANGTDGLVYVFYKGFGWSNPIVTGANAHSIEGIAINGSTLYVGNDGYFHNTSATNTLQYYTINESANTNNGTVSGSPALFQGQDVVYDLTQTTAANQPLVVSGGALTVDGVSNYSALFAIDDDLDFTGTFTGLTAANVYAVTDNAGTVTLDTLTAQDITLVTSLGELLTSIAYDHVAFVAIYPDATDQAAIQAKILTQFSVT